MEKSMYATTLLYAQNNLDALINQSINNCENIIISSDNLKSIVMMPLDEFNAWQETIYLLSNPINANHLFESINQVHNEQIIEKELID